MRTAIKPQYEETWFSVPKVLVEAYLPTIGINAFAIYIILSAYQDHTATVTDYLPLLRHKSDMRNMKTLRVLDYLRKMRLVTDSVVNGKKAITLTFQPQPIPKKK